MPRYMAAAAGHPLVAGSLPRRAMLLAFLTGDNAARADGAAAQGETGGPQTPEAAKARPKLPLIAKATRRKDVWDSAGSILAKWAASEGARKACAGVDRDAFVRGTVREAADAVEEERQRAAVAPIQAWANGAMALDDDDDDAVFYGAAATRRKRDGKDLVIHWWEAAPQKGRRVVDRVDREAVEDAARPATLEAREAMWRLSTRVRELGGILDGECRQSLPAAVRTLLADCAVRHAEVGDAPAAFAMLALSERGVAAEGCAGGLNATSSEYLATLVAWFAHHGNDAAALEAASEALRMGWELPEAHVAALLECYAEARPPTVKSREVVQELIALRQKHMPVDSLNGEGGVRSWRILVGAACRAFGGDQSSVAACRPLLRALPRGAARTAPVEVAAAIGLMVRGVAADTPLRASSSEASAAMESAMRARLARGRAPASGDIVQPELRPRSAALDRAAEVLVEVALALDADGHGDGQPSAGALRL